MVFLYNKEMIKLYIQLQWMGIISKEQRWTQQLNTSREKKREWKISNLANYRIVAKNVGKMGSFRNQGQVYSLTVLEQSVFYLTVSLFLGSFAQSLFTTNRMLMRDQRKSSEFSFAN